MALSAEALKKAAQKAKRIQIAKGIATAAHGLQGNITGKGQTLSTEANDSNPAEWTPEPVVNQTKEQNTVDLEKKTPSSFLSNYDIG